MPLAADRCCIPRLTIVVPAFNEAPRLRIFHDALASALALLRVEWDVVLVDDGSADGTGAAWRELMAWHPNLSLVSLARNAGKEAALMEGLRRARGDAVVPMDVDLQDPPALIGEFLARWRDGHDMVYGQRRRRADPWWKRLTAACHYRWLRASARLDLPADAGDFRLLDRSVVERLLALPEVDRYTRGLYALVSARPCGVAYDRPARAGERRYRLSASIDQALAGLSFTDAPLQLVFLLGMLVSVGALLGLVAVVAAHALGSPMAWGWASQIFALGLLGGVQLLSLGIIGLYLGRMFREVKRRPPALVASVHGLIARESMQRAPPLVAMTAARATTATATATTAALAALRQRGDQPMSPAPSIQPPRGHALAR